MTDVDVDRHTLTCDECGARTTAPLPPGAGEGAFGPRLEAMLATCSGVYRLSRRAVENLTSDFFNVDISLGSVSACEETVSEAVAEARKYVEAAPVAHVDETGCRQAVGAAPAAGDTVPEGDAGATKHARPSARAWLWTGVVPMVTVFLVHAKRGTLAARELPGSFAGILVSDRWSAYSFQVPQAEPERNLTFGIDAARRQLCPARPDLLEGH